MNLVLKHCMKFVTRGTNTTGYVSRQQLWLTDLLQTLKKQSGYSCFCLDKRPEVFGAARYRSQVENPETQYCYLNSSTSDKLFNTFVSRRTDDKDQLKFVIEKQVGETGSGQVYILKNNLDGESVTKEEQQQRGAGADRFRSRSRRSRLQIGSKRTTPGFIVLKCQKSKSSVHRTTKRNEKTTIEEEKSPAERIRVEIGD